MDVHCPEKLQAMEIDFEELDSRDTPIGVLSVRRRTEVFLGNVTVFEIKLDDAFLMSSLFTASEKALARLGLAAVDAGEKELTVAVGGLGLGYTAATVLEDSRVRSLHVIEALHPVIEWHRRGILPLGDALAADERCHLFHGDFFERVRSGHGLVEEAPHTGFNAILVDIDHSPRNVLDAAHGSFYTREGLQRLALHLEQAGVFGLWSDDPPDDAFKAVLEDVFEDVQAHVVSFPNPYLNRDSACTVYVARHPKPLEGNIDKRRLDGRGV